MGQCALRGEEIRIIENVHYIKISNGKYKYKMITDYVYNINSFHEFSCKYIELTHSYISIKKDYEWDGASYFPDICSVMRGALVHDAFYQIVREDNSLRENERVSLKKYADMLLKDICLEDNMPEALANTVHLGVSTLGSVFI